MFSVHVVFAVDLVCEINQQKLIGGLYPTASKFWAHFVFKPASAKNVLFLFWLVFPVNTGFPQIEAYSILNIVRKIKAGFNLQHTRCILCQIMCHFRVVLVSRKEDLSWLLRVVVSRQRILKFLSSCTRLVSRSPSPLQIILFLDL